ncbi:MAG: uracil-DNA glycosylase family protein [Nitrospirota bacterium]
MLPEIKEDKNGCRRIYCINVVLHGPKDKIEPPSAFTYCSCSEILKAYVRLLNPKIVVALGENARDSLACTFEIDEFNENKPSYSQLPSFKNTYFWWTFHPASQSYNKKKDYIEKRFRQIGQHLSKKIGK